MLNKNVEDGILRFIKYIRRMNQLSDEQLQLLLGLKINHDPIYYTSIGITVEGHIKWLREMSAYTDDQLIHHLREQAKLRDPVLSEIFEDSAKKKAIIDMERSAKDLKSDGRLFAKKIGADTDLKNYIRKVA